MKFLVTGRPGPMPIPPEQAVGLFQAAKASVDAAIAEGGIDCSYLFLEGGGFVITNADSHEEALDKLLEFPLYPFTVWEVRALCDWSHGYDKFIELFQKLASLGR